MNAAERSYKQNPYHNNTHAADVTQTAAVIMRSLEQQIGGLTKLERFAVIISAAVHDMAHPGLNNDFLIKTRDKSAVIYNDRSVNENMHVSRAFQLALEHDELNIFENFSNEEYTTVHYTHCMIQQPVMSVVTAAAVA